ncbi:hypothetical protein GCM10020000_83600 [Streptomyces olivoverticillatus]
MKLARKLAAGAMAASLTTVGFVTATPASATVVNSTCNLSSVVRVDYNRDSGHYCYVWDGNTSSNQGWMDIQEADEVCSVNYTGYVQDISGGHHHFSRGRCTTLGGAHLILIVFDGN